VEEYLPKCLNSLYQQTLRPEEFEIIIIDDNSSDKTLQIAKNFTKKRSNIKIIHNSENLGPGVSRNKGLELAQGDYIYFIDGDDYIDPITLEQLLIEAYNNHADIVAASFARVNDQGEILFIKNEKKFFSSSRIQLLRNLLKFKIHHVVWNKLIKRELFDNSDIKFPEGLHEDVPMVRQLFLAAANVFYKPEIYYYWVKRKGSITSSITKSHIDDFLKGLVSMRKYIFEEYGGGVFRNVRDAIDYGMQAVVRVLSKRIVYSGSLKPHEKVSLYKYLYKRILEEPFLKESVLLETNEKDLSYKFFMLFSSKDLSSEEAAKDFENLVKVQPKKDKGIQSNIQEKSFRKFLTTHKGKLKDKYNYFIDRIVSFLYKKNIKRKNKNQHKNQLRKDCESKISHDVLFFADCDYHIRNAAIISELLLQRGFSTGIIDMTKRLNQGKRQLKEEERKKYQDLNFYEFDNNTYQNVDLEVLKVAIYFNDAGIHNRQIRNLRNKNIITIGIDEGVNDFLKLSEGFSAHLSPYRTTEYIFLPGEFETQFFKDRPGQYFVVGLPSIKKFYEEKPSFPKKPLIAINVNFTYGVLTNFREKFVKTAIKGCE
jgi:glycosyltransferase involved in cell wall biosynthesis